MGQRSQATKKTLIPFWSWVTQQLAGNEESSFVGGGAQITPDMLCWLSVLQQVWAVMQAVLPLRPYDPAAPVILEVSTVGKDTVWSLREAWVGGSGARPCHLHQRITHVLGYLLVLLAQLWWQVDKNTSHSLRTAMGTKGSGISQGSGNRSWTR